MICLSNPCRALYSLLVFWFFICFSNSLQADTTLAATAFASGTALYSSANGACAANASYPYYKQLTSNPNSGTPVLNNGRYTMGIAGGETGVCGSTNGATNGPGVSAVEWCPYPGSWTKTGDHLYCGTGAPVTTCPAAGTKINTPITTAPVTGNQTFGSMNLCTESAGASCAISCGDAMISYNADTNKSTAYCSSHTFSGSACDTGTIANLTTNLNSTAAVTPLVNPPKSSADCPGGTGFAEVNNKTMCLPGGSTYTGGSTSTTTSTGSTTTTSTTIINNNGTSTTTLTTNTFDTGGTLTGTTTTSYEGTPGQIANLGALGGTSGGSGTSPAPYDPGTAPTFDSTLPGETATPSPKTFGIPTISTTLFTPSASACPAPILFTAMGKDLSIGFQPICDLSSIIRGIILMLASIIGLRILITN